MLVNGKQDVVAGNLPKMDDSTRDRFVTLFVFLIH